MSNKSMSGGNLKRLLQPKSIAVFGGAWGRNVIEQCSRMGYKGKLWPVHPEHNSILGYPCFRSVEDLPHAPDASFIGVNRNLTINIVQLLADAGAGGAVCFASGFSEAAAEDASGGALQQQLIEASGSMPIIGPNCYGLINYLDGALLWPDQHGGKRIERGVAIITQSSNIAINLTMQRRGLAIAYVLTAGNQAKVSLSAMANALLEDDRVTAIGLHVEGFGDLAGLQQLAQNAKAKGKGIVVIKAGRTELSQTAMVSHTNSLSGTDASATALLQRLGFARVNSVTSFLETLKLLHVCGPLSGNSVASMSCSGGEASLMADSMGERTLLYPALSSEQQVALREALGPMVALANPLDYHTYIWNDLHAMTATFTAMLQTPAAITFLVIDFPRTDICNDESWWLAMDALIAARNATGATVGVLATMPENLPESVVDYLAEHNMVALGGIEESLDAVEAAAFIGASDCSSQPLLCIKANSATPRVITEYQSKRLLQQAGMPVATAIEIASVEEASTAAAGIGYPVVVKVSGVAHKTEQGGVVLNVQTDTDLLEHVNKLINQSGTLLLEPYHQSIVAELLVGIVREPDGLFKLTIGSGGILTELLNDTASLLLPVTTAEITTAIQSLNVFSLLNGYRGQPGVPLADIQNAIMALCSWVEVHAESLYEVEINPLLCCQHNVIVADALISATENLPESP